MSYSIVYTPASKRAFKKLQKTNPKITQELIQLIEKQIVINPKSHPLALKMRGYDNVYRVRKGDYRLIYKMIDQQLVIAVLTIGHRRDIYDKLENVDIRQLEEFLAKL